MQIGQKGLDLIKSFEGFRANAYPDPATGALPYTIGYGTTLYPDGKKIKLGDKCTKEQALEWLTVDCNRRAAAIGQLDVNQNQFDAVVSFCYNLGLGAFNKSTLRKKIIRNPNDPTIRDEFNKWVTAAGMKMAGLVRRRKAEADLYFTPL